MDARDDSADTAAERDAPRPGRSERRRGSAGSASPGAWRPRGAPAGQRLALPAAGGPAIGCSQPPGGTAVRRASADRRRRRLRALGGRRLRAGLSGRGDPLSMARNQTTASGGRPPGPATPARSAQQLVLGHLADHARRHPHHHRPRRHVGGRPPRPPPRTPPRPTSTPGSSTAPPPIRQARRSVGPAQLLTGAPPPGGRIVREHARRAPRTRRPPTTDQAVM